MDRKIIILDKGKDLFGPDQVCCAVMLTFFR
jgi:hypothetical protein